eukprot:scaffold680556_cov42-Prasinocladus_malaysianus.AAC.1
MQKKRKAPAFAPGIGCRSFPRTAIASFMVSAYPSNVDVMNKADAVVLCVDNHAIDGPRLRTVVEVAPEELHAEDGKYGEKQKADDGNVGHRHDAHAERLEHQHHPFAASECAERLGGPQHSQALDDLQVAGHRLES